MADSALPESHATGSQVNPVLRQRMLNRAATFSEGAYSNPLAQRRSSLLSETSDTRRSFRSSTDNLRLGKNDMDKLASSEEPSLWHSVPLAFAILPAASGLLFHNGSAVVTDLLLLLLASMFLNWFTRSPWDWYHASQRIQYVEADEPQLNDTILEEDEGSEGSQEVDGRDEAETKPSERTSEATEDIPQTASPPQQAAYRELRRNELWALIACFAGPVIGAYLLHAIRSQLTRPSEGLVSNYNLTIFVMAAEVRPISHIIKLKHARIAHLQRTVRVDPERPGKLDPQEISNRLADMEARLATPCTTRDAETGKISAMVRLELQPQLDALNRAVRRYEKRQAAQSIQNEARFQELESRLNDALSLAAAAVRTKQSPGVIVMVLTYVAGLFTFWLHWVLTVLTCPFRVPSALAAGVRGWFVQAGPPPRKQSKSQGNGYQSASTPKTQTRNGR